MSKEKIPLKRYVFSSFSMLLFVASILIVWRLFSANYPTHSDVFFQGVEAGMLTTMLVAFTSLIGFFLYRLTTK
jgi:hypothetical protein